MSLLNVIVMSDNAGTGSKSARLLASEIGYQVAARGALGKSREIKVASPNPMVAELAVQKSGPNWRSKN